MAESKLNPLKKIPTRYLRLISIVALLFTLLAAVTVLVIYRAEPTLHAAVIETLSARFKSKVELDEFHVSLRKGLEVSGKGMRIIGASDPNPHEPGMQPIIRVAEFRFRMGILAFLRAPRHVDTVYVRGLQLNLPPKAERGEMRNIGPKGGKLEIVVDRFVCENAELIINTEEADKLPLEFDIQSLIMTDIGPGSPMHFDANLTNPKPVGLIVSSGLFGPWQAGSPRETPVSGTYSFDHVDLGTIRGIGGVLASNGKYVGTLDKIVVDGATDTPDFRLATSGRKVPLHTDFHALVDGTSGDTYLEPVKARILESSLVANGSVVRTKDPDGHSVNLDVAIERGRIEDLLKLAIKTDPPIMNGLVRLRTKFELRPGQGDVAHRVKLAGRFQVSGAHFTNAKIQAKLDALSLRSQGKPKLAKENVAADALSEMKGTFDLGHGLLSFSQLQFQVPGTRVHLTGTYSLDGNQFDFHGKAQMDARLSQMVTGWKSILLKPADPFFSKNGAGTELPVKITGTQSEPHFGSDFGHKNDSAIAKGSAIR